MIRVRRVAVPALALACVTAGLASAPAEATVGVSTGAVFNNPQGSAQQRDQIVSRAVDLIAGAGAGSRVRMSMFYADDRRIPDALVAAKKRGVAVQVILDSKGTSKKKSADADLSPYQVYSQILVPGLGTDRKASSWVMACGVGRGCISDRWLPHKPAKPPTDPDQGSPKGYVAAINHNKYLLFESTHGTSDVVFQSSANLHPGRDGLRGWNNAMIVAGNTGLYQAYDTYFDHQVSNRDKAGAYGQDYYDKGQPPAQYGAAKVFFYPRHESNGKPYDDQNTDTVHTILHNTTCKGNTKVGNDKHETIIRVGTNIFSRPYLAKELGQKAAEGCQVDVVENYNKGSKLEKDTMQALLHPSAKGEHVPHVRYFCGSDSTWIHSKELMIEGTYYGQKDRKIVWAGSTNLSGNSLRQSDETMLQLENADVYQAYLGNFAAMWKQPGGLPRDPAHQDPNRTCK